MKRSISIILSLVMAAAVFSACGDHNGSENPEHVTEAATAAEETNIYDMESYENS